LSTEQHIYITDIYIKELRHLKDVRIPVTTLEKGMKHLILTGKNGSGKTSLLETISNYFVGINKSHVYLADIEKFQFRVRQNENATGIELLKGIREQFYTHTNGIMLLFNITPSIIYKKNSSRDTIDNDIYNFPTAFFSAKRSFSPVRPTVIEKIELPFAPSSTDDTSKEFLKYLVFMRNRLTDAYYTKDYTEVRKIEEWFIRFEITLRKIFNDEKLSLNYNSTHLNFIIHQTGRNSFDFNTLPDGYASILRIVTELMLRMEKDKTSAYNAKGIVLIDEIEAHLHIELQKNILPLLTTLFPNIQFIVSTHSPFILNSIENAVVYDIENDILFEDASELSISGLIKGFFQQTSEYSASMERRITELEALGSKTDRTEADNQRLADLLSDLKTLSPLFSPEMYLRFSIIQQSFLKKIPVTA
jgi:predicted ATPase